MERRILEAKDLHSKVRRECLATIELLESLIKTCANHVDSLDKLNNKDLRTNLKYFLSLSQFQHATHQKISELNVVLEEFILDQQLADFGQFKEASSRSSLIHEDHGHALSAIVKCELAQKSVHDLKKFNEHNEANLHLTNNCLIDIEDSNQATLAHPLATETLATSFVCHSHESQPLNLISIENPIKSSINNTVNEQLSNALILQPPLLPEKADTPSVQQVDRPATSIWQKIKSFQKDTVQGKVVKEFVAEESDCGDIKFISDAIRTLPTLASEDKFMKPHSKFRMPDISLKAAESNRFVVDDDDGSKQKNDSNRKLGSAQSSVSTSPVSEEKVFKKALKVKSPVEKPNEHNGEFELGHRHAPEVGDVCMIGFVESPSNFYIQVSDENSIYIDVISAQLDEINNGTLLICNSKLEAMDRLGKFCSIQINSIWYRVEVIDWRLNSNSNSVYARLVDYGIHFTPGYDKLWPLPEFCRKHMFAQKCNLAYLYPPGSTKESKVTKWPLTCIEAMENYFGNMHETVFKITYVHESPLEKYTYEVDLVKVTDNIDSKSIGEVLLEAELAVQICDDLDGLMKDDMMRNQVLAAHGIAGITPSMTQEEIFDIYLDDSYEEPSNINEAVMNYNPRDEAETCRNIRPDGTCYKGSACKFRHEVLRSGFTNDKVAVYANAFSELCLPDAGEDIMLIISHVMDIQCFYAQIKSNSRGINCSMVDLIGEMNDPNVIKKYTKFKQSPSVGEIVIAPHWNGFWYRGQIREVNSLDVNLSNAEVYFVDFGDVLIIETINLREIQAEFLELPFQAVECRLYNIRHKEGANEEVEKKHFESHYLGKTLNAHVVAVPGHHLVVLLDTNTQNDVGLQMIEEGYGELNTEHNFPDKRELVLVD